jgi:hypothetical protein
MSLPPVFEPVEAPRGASETGEWASWYTWSTDFRALLSRLVSSVDPAWPTPHVRELRSGDFYTRTFSLSPIVQDDPDWGRLLDELRPYAASLVTMPKPPKVMLLTGLLDDLAPYDRIRFVLAALRETIVWIFEDEDAAYYAPLGSTGLAVGEFLAHSDLYVPDLLLNLFQEVPADESGASVFISADRLCELLRTTPSVPAGVEAKIRDLLYGKLQQDSFNDFYKTLYGRENPWSESLRSAVACNQVRIRLRTGEGYFINDRAWLHGREAPSCGVGANRLHRLVFQHRLDAASVAKHADTRGDT